MFILVARCTKCGSEFELSESCPNGHPPPYALRVKLRDCEVRDFERFALLPSFVQQLVLTSIEVGEAEGQLLPILLRLRDYGVVVCN
ncbi:MAG: hypothetical protein OWQ51_03770 [Pyrobaculum arsenaticum]|uniref:Uncharacterized protein n=1 Tax=Pyrobaculum arsenaticum (strain DSM 13514 / JCM 11321 / PZ6) TaxID=340102 RepID=A4WMU8_PYRAR|nr:hypothetical protein [Pyrobaculum arsenaticum]ABP51715.1 hypothetical protein Pars_2169 [Pyrobaculum arsenaticum DSM 13514]MCY0890091.1 hypothetical protein [Pyrobaculum arsenaticum]